MNKRFLFALPLALAALLGATTAFAASVSASLDREHAALGQSVVLTVTVTDGSGTVDTSPLTDFDVMPQGRSSRVEIINGAQSSSEQQYFLLLPKREGHLTIPALPVQVGSETFVTQPLLVNVETRSQDSRPSGDLFVSATLSKKKAYVGEPLLYLFTFARAVDIGNARFSPPPFEGFASHQLPQEKHRTTIDGRLYEVSEIPVVLTPLVPGEQRVAPAELLCDVIVGMDSIFPMSRSETRVLRTETISLDVRSLPPAPAGNPFSGLIGSFDLALSVENNSLDVGQGTRLVAVLSGKGNLHDASVPKLALPEGLKAYEEAPTETLVSSAGGYEGTRTYTWALLPAKPGSYDFSPLTLVYFDPEKEEYVALKGENLQVAAGGSAAPSSAPLLTTSPTPTLVEENPVLSADKALSLVDPGMGAPPPAFGSFLLFASTPPLLVGLLTLLRQWRKKRASRVPGMRERALEAFQLARNAKDETWVAHARAALSYALFHRGGGAGRVITPEEAGRLCVQGGCPEEIPRVVRLLDRLDAIGYGGHANDDETRKLLLSEVGEAVRSLCR